LHLLLGDQQDLCCAGVRDALEARGHPTQIIANPLVQPPRFSWRLDTKQSGSSLVWDEEPPVRDDRIAGVLVRSAAWIDPAGWQIADLSYVQAETQAALLAWLWSLACPVVNRYVPAIWYRPQAPLLSWHRRLERSGLPTLETLVTNVEQEAREFAGRLEARGPDGIVYGALTSEARYLVASDEDWRGMAALQRITPVCLYPPHGEAQRVCVVGDHVVWDGEPTAENVRLEPGLRSFAAAAGLAFVALTLAPTSKGICVIAVETHPRVEDFGHAAREEIVGGIVQLLTTEAEVAVDR
jgi:hypothetical protein